LPGSDQISSGSKHGTPDDTKDKSDQVSSGENHSKDLLSTTETTTKETTTSKPDAGHQQTFWEYFGSDEHPALFLLFTGGLLIGTAGISVAIVEKLGIEILARSHEQAYTVFRGGSRELEMAINPRLLQMFREKPPNAPEIGCDEVPVPKDINDRSVEHAQRVIEALGREAALESAQWLLLRRSKPLELPLGG
jgi:hypothetical protein